MFSKRQFKISMAIGVHTLTDTLSSYYKKNANIKFAHVTATIETMSFPALLAAVSVADAVASVVFDCVVAVGRISVEAGFVASTWIPDTTLVAARTYEVDEKEHCFIIFSTSVA